MALKLLTYAPTGAIVAAATTSLSESLGGGAEMALGEQTLEELEGYCGSRPVRIGNEAYKQHQSDAYGEFVDWANLMIALGAGFDADDHARASARRLCLALSRGRRPRRQGGRIHDLQLLARGCPISRSTGTRRRSSSSNGFAVRRRGCLRAA